MPFTHSLPALSSFAARWAPRVFGACLSLAAAAAHAQGIATFTLQDKTNLPQGTYQIYVTGFSAGSAQAGNPTLVLQADGSWATPTAPTGTTAIPCYRYPQDIAQIQINGAYPQFSGRVYYFIVTDLTTFPHCTPQTAGNGLFNSATAFTYSQINPMNLAEPATIEVSQQTMPAWTYSEIGASASNGTIDLSQVDFFTFPMNSTANVISATPANPAEMGNPVGTAANPNPNAAVNHASIRDSFHRYIDSLAATANGGKTCAQDPSPSPCAYLDLLQDVTTPSSSVPLYVIQNPGGYLGQYTSASQASRLNTVFDGAIAKLWSTTSSPTLVLDTGGILGGSPNNLPQDTFTSSIVSITYPGSNPALTVTAMKFTGTTASKGMVAYIVSPKDYQAGCASGAIPNCVNSSSTGYQVFAGAGVFDTPPAGTFTSLTGLGLLTPAASTAYGDTGYYNLVARLGFLVSGAMNRGVALVACPSTLRTWQCWQDETYWYPTASAPPASPMFPDLTQNLFSRWMHTATIGGVPMFVRPSGAVQSASSVPGQGKAMGMAYGFSNDENPTPPVVPSLPQPEVPSKFDGTVVYGASTQNTITFGPWVGAPQNPTLAVAIPWGGGSVTSSPAGINCESACSQSYPAGTSVTLTATPNPSAIFFQWKGACSGSRSTCTVVVNEATTVKAEFAQIDATPTAYGLHVVVSGPGDVRSVPAGVDCGTASCSKAFPAGTTVTLTATPVVGATFKAWTGACAGSGPTCSVTMSAAKTVGASFVAPSQFALTVQGGVGGTVTTTPGGIDCGTACVAGFAAGMRVGLVATPKPGFRFSGWTGACSGTGTCDLVMDADKTASAAFTATPPGQHAITVHDFGSGTITSLPAGIDCGSTCSAAFAAGTRVTLIATPDPGQAFAGWSGDCSGLDACTIYVDDLMNVNAMFVPNGSGAGVTAQAIPTLSEWSLALLAALMVLLAAVHRRRAVRSRV